MERLGKWMFLVVAGVVTMAIGLVIAAIRQRGLKDVEPLLAKLPWWHFCNRLDVELTSHWPRATVFTMCGRCGAHPFDAIVRHLDGSEECLCNECLQAELKSDPISVGRSLYVDPTQPEGVCNG